MPNEEWYIKQAYKENYWEKENFAGFLRWYANPDRENAILPLGINSIIDIVEKPWKTHLRTKQTTA